MTNQEHQWPTHESPYHALRAATHDWGDRLRTAQERHLSLDGELPAAVAKLAIGIVDGNTESAENFSMLDIYDRQRLNPEDSGCLLYVNYEGNTPPHNTRDLVDTIHEQQQRTTTPVAMAVVGYDSKRRIDRIRNDAWDIAVGHALMHKISHPVIGISNDADMVGASPDYFSNMTQNEYVGQPKVWGSEVEFSQPGGAELPLHKLIAYLNGNRQLMKTINSKPVIYGASLGLTLQTYAASGGWMGQHSESNPYGIGEPSRLILNVWEQLTGRQGSMDNTDPAYDTCARRVGGLAVVSPRREIIAYARELGKKNNLLSHLNTEPTNPYRGLNDAEIAHLAGSVAVDDPAFIEQLDVTDDIFLDSIANEQHASLKVAQHALREKLGLPLTTRKRM